MYGKWWLTYASRLRDEALGATALTCRIRPYLPPVANTSEQFCRTCSTRALSSSAERLPSNS
eukprot:6037942-Prymnesium_polylepis.2